MTQPLAERYRERLPLTNETPIISLGEGSTPLLPAPRLSEALGSEMIGVSFVSGSCSR